MSNDQFSMFNIQGLTFLENWSLSLKIEKLKEIKTRLVTD